MKDINKILTYVFIVLFIVVFSFYNFSDYKNFHKANYEIENTKKLVNEKLSNFELEDIKKINNINIYPTPDKDLLTKIVTDIDNAKEKIFLETYILTEKKVQEALVRAKKRWINIKVILEKAPYMAYNINNKSYQKLLNAWIDVKWSDKDDYSFNHSKVLIIDDLSIISTGNFSYSTFTKNRDLFIFTKNENINSKLIENFENDYIWKKINIFDENLIFSPNSSRVKFEKLFESAEENIKMYFQYIKDDELLNKLIKIKNEKNIDIEIIIAETAKDDENVIKLKKQWIKIKVMDKYKMHSKAILIDNKYLFVWSINFSDYSIDRNREIWILIRNNEIINEFLYIYEQDIKN